MKRYLIRICTFALAFLLCVQPVTAAALDDITETSIVDAEMCENGVEALNDNEDVPADDTTPIEIESETVDDDTDLENNNETVDGDTEPIDNDTDLENNNETVDGDTKSIDNDTKLGDDNETVDGDTESIDNDAELADDNETVDEDAESIDNDTELEDDNETIGEEPEELPVTLPTPAASIQRVASNIECWIIAPILWQNRDVLILETPAGVNCLPETVPAKLFEVELYESNLPGYAGKIIEAEYVVDYVHDGQGNMLDKEFAFSTPDLYTVYATIVIPPGYAQSANPSYKGNTGFNFIITVTAPEPDLSFSHYKISDAYAEAGSSPNEWDLQDSVVCSIRDRNFSQPDIELGTMPITWDLDDIVIDAPGVDVNGEYEATVSGVITISDSIDITDVDGINDDHTVSVEIYVVVRKTEATFGFLRPTKYITNPDFKDDGDAPFVSFAVNFIEAGWGSDFSIWLTADDGKTFTDVNGSENIVIYAGGKQEYVVSYVDFYNLEYNKWYGVCLELRGDYPYAGTTETIYFMFTEDDVYSEPSGGDRNGDGRWPFINSGDNEQPPAGNNAPEDNANGNNDNHNGDNNDDSGNNNNGSNDSSNNNVSSASSDSSSSDSRNVTSPFSFGGNTDSVTGKRLESLMIVYPYNVPFVSNGSQLQIPAEFIKLLGLSQSGTFSISASKVNKNSFSIQLNVNGKTTDYSGEKPYTARIPYTPANGATLDNLLIIDSSGNIQPVSYYDPRGYFVFKTNQFGNFSIMEGKPVSFSDFTNGYLDFLSARGIITGTSGQKFNPYNAAEQSDLYIMLDNLSGGSAFSLREDAPEGGRTLHPVPIEQAESLIYPQTALTYSVAVSLLEKYAEQIGVDVDRKELLSVLSIDENTVLSRYGCIKLAAEFIKKL